MSKIIKQIVCVNGDCSKKEDKNSASNDFHWNKCCHWNSIYSLLLSQYLKNMKRILKIWRYCTIGVIISLLGITIILMGCRTNTNLKKGVNKSIMNEPIVTY